jgi:hypothetical protein
MPILDPSFREQLRAKRVKTQAKALADPGIFRRDASLERSGAARITWQSALSESTFAVSPPLLRADAIGKCQAFGLAQVS